MKCQLSFLHSRLTQGRWNIQRKRLVVTRQNMAELVKGLENGTWALARMPKRGKSYSTADKLVREVRTDIIWAGRGRSQVDPVYS